MKANHNTLFRFQRSELLFTNNSKIQNESKSQHKSATAAFSSSCLPIIQRYKMKANHNMVKTTQLLYTVVYQ